MNWAGLMIDIGNIVFFLSNFPQMVTTYRNRSNPEVLKGLNPWLLIGYMIATIFFVIGGLFVGSMGAIILGITNNFFFGLQLYWKWKCARS